MLQESPRLKFDLYVWSLVVGGYSVQMVLTWLVKCGLLVRPSEISLFTELLVVTMWLGLLISRMKCRQSV